jgi:uncharacterized protein (DUF1330 family)
MPAYVIINIVVNDPDTFAGYLERAPAVVAQYGGRYLVRGGALERLEGDWTPARLTVLEFPSLADAKRWDESEEYRPLKALRQAAADAQVVVAEGFGR